MKKLAVTLIMSAFLLLAACSSAPAETPNPSTTGLTSFQKMLSLVPASFLGKHDLWFSDLAEAKSVYGFQDVNNLDALMQLSADQRKTLSNALAAVPEIQRISNWTQIAPVIGFDAWMVDQTIFDDVVPPEEFSILRGSFDQAGIRSKLAAQGYQKISYGGYDYLSLNEDFSPGQLSSPISGQVLAQLNRLGFVSGDLITAPDTASVTGVVDARSGNQTAAIADPGVLTLSAGLGDVLSGVLFTAQRLMNPGFAQGFPSPFNFALPANWGTLHQYQIVGMGYKDDGRTRSWTIWLYYADPAAAQEDAGVLLSRLNSYIFNTEFEQGPGQSFKPIPLSDQFEISQPLAHFRSSNNASVLTVDLKFKPDTPGSTWVRYVHDFRDLLFLAPDPTPYLAKPAAPNPISVEQASAQLKEKGYVVVDTAEKASLLAGYEVATPAFVPAGFVPVMMDDTGSFALNKLGRGLPNAPDMPTIVDQKYAENPDPTAPHGPFFILEQTSQQHGLVGTAIDMEIAGYPGKKILIPPDGRPPGIHLAWTDGTRYYDLEAELTGPLDEATILQVAGSVGIR